MEILKTMTGGASSALVCVCFCALSAVPIVFLVYLGIYAFDNPDTGAWYGLVKKEQTLFATEEAGKLVGAEELVDIHNRFVVWFLWGFIQMLAPIASALATSLGMIISPMIGQILSMICSCAVCSSGLAWWITGIVWRFRQDGLYAVGDIVKEGVTGEQWAVDVVKDGSLFQHHSGYFIAIYYFICFALMALSLLCGIVVAIWGCIASKKHDGYDD